MDGELIFCTDSVLRFRSHYDETTALPLLAIQNTTAATDPWFLLRFFRHPVIIEAGTTLANIFVAIEPWKDLLGAYLDRDVGAWIDEARKPSSPGTVDLEWIGIDRRSSVYRCWVREGMEESEDVSDYFNRERLSTDEFDIESVCDASGFIQGEKERWSLSENIHEIKNLPVILYNKQTLTVSQKEELLNEQVSGVRRSERGLYVYGDTTFVFFEVMEALFISGLFFYSPNAAENNLAVLTSRLSELESTLTGEGEREPTERHDDQPVKIEVVEGAFDTLISDMESEAEAWQQLKKACQQADALPVRIGVITPAEPPEMRLCGEVLNRDAPERGGK